MENATQRLNILFLNHQALLEKDTGLRLPVSQTKPVVLTTTDKIVTDEKKRPSHGDQIVASKTSEVLQTGLNHGKNGKDGHEFDERTAFQSGIEASPSMLAQSFCPAAAIMKLPYKYMRGTTAEMIGRRFFDAGRFWAREWDLYYIFPPQDLAQNPLLLMPASQVQQFLDMISKDCNMRLTIPTNPELGLLLSFLDEDMPKPQHLGRSSDRDSKDDLISTMSLQPRNSMNSIDQPSDGLVIPVEIADAFREKMEAGLNATRKKSKASKEKRRALRIERQREWVQSLKRAQCYLGIHPRFSNHKSEDFFKDELTSLLPPLLLEEVAPYPFADNPIFISIDVEWNERQRNQITEVGISTLDTLDIAHVAPGPGGKNWQQMIRSRHIRIKEYAHVVNCQFVLGCPDRFGFGKSEFFPHQDAARVVESCFRPPYSAQAPLTAINEESTGNKTIGTIKPAIEEYKWRPRNVVLVGHGLHADISYLRSLGCDLFSDEGLNTSSQASVKESSNPTTGSPIFDTLDTATMFQALKRDVNPRSLENVLASLGMFGWNLHNAGNDARYTLEAMVRMIINARVALDKGPEELSGDFVDWALRPVADKIASKHELAWQTEVDRRVSEAVADKEGQIRDDCKIWQIVTGWDIGTPLAPQDIDGGQPKGLVFT